MIYRRDVTRTAPEVRAGAAVNFEVGAQVVALSRLDLAEAARVDVGLGRITIAAGGYEAGQLRAWISTARNGGAGDGPGILSRAAAVTPNRAIGHRILPDGSAIVGFAAIGDATMDGRIDILDLIALNAGGAYGSGQVDAGWWQGDFNDDGQVDLVDLLTLKDTGLYGSGSYLPVAGAGVTASATPPASVSAPIGSVLTQPLDAFTWAVLARETDSETPLTRKIRRFGLLGQG